MTINAWPRRLLIHAYRSAAAILGGTGISQVYPFNRIERVFLAKMRSPRVTIDGHVLHLDPSDSLNLSVCGHFEPFESEIIGSLVKPGAIIADIGANIGFYTLLFARWTGPAGKVHAFEPMPSNMELLQKNVRANGYGNVLLNCAAVTHASGFVSLFLAGENTVDHRLSDPEGTRRSIEVPALRLDEYFARVESPVDFIKMDIQGAEAAVIKTLGPLVKRNPELILVTEFWPYGLDLHGSDPVDVLRDLTAFGFDLQELDERRREVRPVNPVELLARYTQENRRHTNLLCRKTSGSSL